MSDVAGNTKTRRVATSIDLDTGDVTVSYDGEQIGQINVNRLQSQNSILGLAAYGAATLLSRSTGGDNPRAGVAEVIDRLERGEWRPGRQKIESEPEPIVQALAQHLNISAEAVVDRFLPTYCSKQGHIASNGRLLIERAKRELERHEKIGPLMAKILAQRAKRDGTAGASVDLASLVVESAADADHAGSSEHREAAE